MCSFLLFDDLGTTILKMVLVFQAPGRNDPYIMDESRTINLLYRFEQQAHQPFELQPFDLLAVISEVFLYVYEVWG